MPTQKRNAILINCVGEQIYGKEYLSDYNIIKYPALPKVGLLRNLIKNEKPDNQLIAADSLRRTFIKMLQDHINEPDDTLFGESDVYPSAEFDWDNIPWDAGYDIIRPYKTVIVDGYKTVSKPEKVEWMPASWYFIQQKFPSPAWFKSHCGAHALIIPKNKREKIIELFQSKNDHIDMLLVHGVATRRLNMAVLNYNAFGQMKHPSLIDPNRPDYDS